MKNQGLLSLLVLFLLCSFPANSQVTYSEKFYGETSTDDHFNDIQPTPDGGYIAVGESQTEGQLGQVYLVKLDATGNIEMEKRFGTAGIETAHSVALLADRYVIGGSTYLDGQNNRDAYLITVDFAGNLVNETSFGGQGDDVIYTVAALENGDIAIGATYEDVIDTGADCQVRRYSRDLELLAQTDYRRPVFDYPHFILEDPSTGHILVGGRTNANGLLLNISAGLDSILWTIDNYGNSLFYTGIVFDEDHYAVNVSGPHWEESYIGLVDKNTGQIGETFPLPSLTSSTYQVKKMVKQDNQIYLLAEYLKPYLFRYDITEDTISEAFELPQFTTGIAVRETGSFAIAYQPLSDVNKIASVQEFDTTLNSVWDRSAGNPSDHSTQQGKQVIEAEEGRFFLGGITRRGNWRSSNVLIQKIQPGGEVIWESEFSPGYINKFAGMARTSDDGCIVAISYELSGSSFDKLRFQKMNSDGTPAWSMDLESLNIIGLNDGQLLKNEEGDFYFSASVVGQSLSGTYVAKLTEAGDLIWESDASEENEYFFSQRMILSGNQDLVLAGELGTSEGRIPGLSRMNSDGELVWSSSVVDEPGFDYFEGVVEGTEGHLFAVTEYGNLAKFDEDGALLNENTLDIPGDKGIQDVRIAADNQFYLLNVTNKFGGDTIHPIFNLARARCTRLHIFDSSWGLQSTHEFGVGRGTEAEHLLTRSEGGIAFFGAAMDGNTTKGHLVWFDAGVNDVIDIQPQGKLSVFPSVSTGEFSVELASPHQGELSLQVYNTLGQAVQQIEGRKGNERWLNKLDISHLPAGTYHVQVRLGKYAWVKSLIKVGA